MIATLVQVALGGALGASARYLTNVAALRLLGGGFPYGTLAVNILGSALMGVVVVTLAKTEATRLSPLLMTGLLGGFTTFSAFSLDAVNLVERGAPVLAACYVGASVALSILALIAGMALARGVFA